MIPSEIDIYEKIADIALGFVGQPLIRRHPKDHEDHRVGCFPETGFDCAGFVGYVLNEAGLTVPQKIRHSREFWDHYGYHVTVDLKTSFNWQGLLVFFSWHGFMPNHIGIMVSPTHFVDAPGNSPSILLSELKPKSIPNPVENPQFTDNPIGFKRIRLGNL